MAIIIIKRYGHQYGDGNRIDLYLGQRPQPSCGFQHCRLATCQGQHGYRHTQHGIVQRVVTPRERQLIHQRTDSHTEQESHHSGYHAPQPDHLYVVCQLFLLLSFIVFRQLGHCTKRDTQVRTLRGKVLHRHEQRIEPHTCRAQQQSHELIAYKTYQCDKYLHTSKHSRVFQHVVVAVIVAWILHISYLADAKVQQKF